MDDRPSASMPTPTAQPRQKGLIQTLIRDEAGIAASPEHIHQQEVMRAVALGLGAFERMRAHEVHLLAAQMSRAAGSSVPR